VVFISLPRRRLGNFAQQAHKEVEERGAEVAALMAKYKARLPQGTQQFSLAGNAC
jgi:hypothetical protein